MGADKSSQIVLLLQKMLLRRPLTRLEITGSVYPFYVYDGNMPLAPILRQRQCSLMYDVR